MKCYFQFIITLFCICYLTGSCTSDNNDYEDLKIAVPAVTLIGDRNDAIIQINLEGEITPPVFIDHSAINGITTGFNSYDINEPYITFFSRSISGYKASEINLSNATGSDFGFVCIQDEASFILYAEASENHLVVLSSFQDEASQLQKISAHIRNKSGETCSTLLLGETGVFYFKAGIFEEQLYIAYVEGQGNTVIKQIDIPSLSLKNTFNIGIGENFRATANNDRLYIFKPQETFTIYSTSSGEKIKEVPFGDFNFIFDPGFFETSFYGSKMLQFIILPQPNLYPYYPVIFDLETAEIKYPNENNRLFTQIEQNLNGGLEEGKTAMISLPFKVDIERELILFNCRFFNRNEFFSNGLVYADFDGNIISYNVFDYSLNVGEILIRK